MLRECVIYYIYKSTYIFYIYSVCLISPLARESVYDDGSSADVDICEDLGRDREILAATWPSHQTLRSYHCGLSHVLGGDRPAQNISVKIFQLNKWITDLPNRVTVSWVVISEVMVEICRTENPHYYRDRRAQRSDWSTRGRGSAPRICYASYLLWYKDRRP